MTNKQLKIAVRALHPRLSVKWAPEYGEYQVRVRGLETATYYTDDRDDALQTAARMAANLNTNPQTFKE